MKLLNYDWKVNLEEKINAFLINIKNKDNNHNVDKDLYRIMASRLIQAHV